MVWANYSPEQFDKLEKQLLENGNHTLIAAIKDARKNERWRF